MIIDVRVPPAGESITEADIARWFKEDGDIISLQINNEWVLNTKGYNSRVLSSCFWEVLQSEMVIAVLVRDENCVDFVEAQTGAFGERPRQV